MDFTLWKKKAHKQCQHEERKIKCGREVAESEERRSADEFFSRWRKGRADGFTGGRRGDCAVMGTCLMASGP